MNDQTAFLATAANDQMAVAYEAVRDARFPNGRPLPAKVLERYADAVWEVRNSLLLAPALGSHRQLVELVDATGFGRELDHYEATREMEALVREVTTSVRVAMGLPLLAWLFQPLVWKGVEILVRLIVARLLADWWEQEEATRRVAGSL